MDLEAMLHELDERCERLDAGECSTAESVLIGYARVAAHALVQMLDGLTEADQC